MVMLSKASPNRYSPASSSPGWRSFYHTSSRCLFGFHHHRRLARHPSNDRYLRQVTQTMPEYLANSSVVMSQSDVGITEPVVVFEDVSIKFDLKPVLQNISFAVHRGETRIILGPAGGGKSVLIKLVDGPFPPDSGVIRVFGEDVTKMREVDLFKLRGRIGMVFQESALFDSLS